MAEITAPGTTTTTMMRGSRATNASQWERPNPASRRIRLGREPAPIATAERWLALGQVVKASGESIWHCRTLEMSVCS